MAQQGGNAETGSSKKENGGGGTADFGPKPIGNDLLLQVEAEKRSVIEAEANQYNADLREREAALQKIQDMDKKLQERAAGILSAVEESKVQVEAAKTPPEQKNGGHRADA